MKLKYRLLDHPFYQAWTMGEVTKEQLSKYHRSYAEFIELMPVYWNKITDSFNLNDEMAKEVVTDEKMHIELWKKWDTKLQDTDDYPHLSEVINELNKMNPSELLGAIQAFEIQQPEVAKTKKEGLLNHYGYNENETVYFDEHMLEEAHINYGQHIMKNFADLNDYENGFNKGAELFYKGLDLYLQ